MKRIVLTFSMGVWMRETEFLKILAIKILQNILAFTETKLFLPSCFFFHSK